MVKFLNGQPIGVEDIITGFQRSDGSRFARPSGVLMGPDGQLYFTSDAGDVTGLFRLGPIPTEANEEGVRAFVTRLYRLLLGREPDSAGLDGWVDDLLSGRITGCDIAFGFIFSPEFINRNPSDEEYVDILYRAFFNREADIDGKNGWLDVLQSGSREEVLDGFLFSQEFANLAASFGIIACGEIRE